MDLVQLRNFLRIAELRSFTRAARECRVSQPALSQQVARLEEELGCLLFDRRGRHLELTEPGKKLLDRARRIVELAEDTAREVQDDGQTGRLVVAAIPTVAPYFLPELLASFRAAFPRARIEIHEEVTDDLLRHCSSGEVDIGLVARPVSARYLEVESVFDEPLLAVFPVGHHLAQTDHLKLDDLAGEPFLLLDEAHCLSGNIQTICQQRAFQPVASGRMTQLTTIQELVALGQGVSLIPEMAARLDSATTRVYRRLTDHPVPTRTIAACWNSYRYQSLLARGFLDILRVVSRKRFTDAQAMARSSSRRKQA